MVQHLACIMDGNRRWARERNFVTLEGHSKGTETIRRVVAFCLKKNISYVSLYTFSLENFKRPQHEQNYLFNLIATKAQEGIEEFLSNNVRVRFLGERSLFPSHVIPAIHELETKTRHCSRLHLNFLFCYGAQQELVAACKRIAQDVKKGTLHEDAINETVIDNTLLTAGMPHPDLIIRTGGAMRLSNFLLFQAAYSELYFLDCFWPDLEEHHLEQAVNYFNTARRNFGS